MKIAFDAKRYFNNTTGLGFYSRTLVEGLQHFYPQHQYALYTPYNKRHLGQLQQAAILPETPMGRWLHPVWRSRWITRQLQKDGVSIFHGLSHELPAGLRKAGIRSVVSMHDLIFLRYPEMYRAIDRAFYSSKYFRAAWQADRVVAISSQTKADLVQFFKLNPDAIQVIGQSCDPVFEQLSLRHFPDIHHFPVPEFPQLPAAEYLLAVGSLTPRKNWHRMLDALALLQQQGVVIPLVMVGTGKSDYATGLRVQASRLKLPVYWIDEHVNTHALARLYRKAAAVVYPSLFEGFGIPILEAMTIGVPVVTSSGGCFEEVGGAAALYTDPLSIEMMAVQIQKALDSNVRQQLSEAASQQIRQFAPEVICAAWMNLYQQL